MKIKKIPLRKCIVCQNQFDKKQLIRVVKNKENEIFIDKTFKAGGRGAYVCNSKECIEKLKKTKALDRTFKCKVDVKIYDDILSEIEKSE